MRNTITHNDDSPLERLKTFLDTLSINNQSKLPLKNKLLKTNITLIELFVANLLLEF